MNFNAKITSPLVDLFEFDTIGVYRGVDGDMDEIIPC